MRASNNAVSLKEFSSALHFFGTFAVDGK